LFALWDLDGDGLVSEAGWSSAHDLMDFNHDGVVTPDEWQSEVARAVEQSPEAGRSRTAVRRGSR
jgi:hypothetical protein